MNEEQLAAMKMLLAERQAKRASGHKKVHRVGRLTLEDALSVTCKTNNKLLEASIDASPDVFTSTDIFSVSLTLE